MLLLCKLNSSLCNLYCVYYTIVLRTPKIKACRKSSPLCSYKDRFFIWSVILLRSFVTSSQPSIIGWKEEGGLFGCYHCLVMLLPAGKGGNLVFLAFVRLYFSAAQTSISLFCSIVFVCTSSASFHRELWDFKSVEHCGIAPRPLCHKQLHVLNLFAPKQKIFTFLKEKINFCSVVPKAFWRNTIILSNLEPYLIKPQDLNGR